MTKYGKLPQYVPNSPPKERAAILLDAANLTDGDRNASYGEPSNNLACAGELWNVLIRYGTRTLSAAESEAVHQICTKLSRVVTGPVVTRDTYVDGACYFAIAGEAAVATSLKDKADYELPTRVAQADPRVKRDF